ncbi:BPTI/Kunitz domain-containing protein [Hippoglossus stenolepis]|uniref:BPTI/Kunitz domain-containing protein n=1 Tax=Hippoglossus stenolepis TaxID=195615 RepID=UPI00159C7AE1|nr:BPTI/Kunitz domain-containing protein [Hippoglossus stenolepis]
MKHLLLLGMAFAAIHVSHSIIPDFCQLDPVGGDGPSFIHSIHYNHLTDRCEPFIYSGIGGNSNRFEKERECIRNCSANAEDIYPMDESKACHFKRASGQCKNQLMRYYYDPIHDKCKKFQWTGCIGNGNRFVTFDSCNRTCDGIHDEGDEIEEDEPDTPIAIICGVLLAVIIVSIFVTVIVLTVRSKKTSAKKMAGGKSKESKSDTPLQEPALEMA